MIHQQFRTASTFDLKIFGRLVLPSLFLSWLYFYCILYYLTTMDEVNQNFDQVLARNYRCSCTS